MKHLAPVDLLHQPGQNGSDKVSKPVEVRAQEMAMWHLLAVANRAVVGFVFSLAGSMAVAGPLPVFSQGGIELPFFQTNGRGPLQGQGDGRPFDGGGNALAFDQGPDGSHFSDAPQIGGSSFSGMARQPDPTWQQRGNGHDLAEGGLGPLAVLGVVAGFVAGTALSPNSRDNILQPWSADWFHYCANRYRTFDARTGAVLASDGNRHFCHPN